MGGGTRPHFGPQQPGGASRRSPAEPPREASGVRCTSRRSGINGPGDRALARRGCVARRGWGGVRRRWRRCVGRRRRRRRRWRGRVAGSGRQRSEGGRLGRWNERGRADRRRQRGGRVGGGGAGDQCGRSCLGWAGARSGRRRVPARCPANRNEPGTIARKRGDNDAKEQEIQGTGGERLAHGDRRAS